MSDFSPAVLLTSQADFRQHRELIKLLNFFGIPWRTENAADLLRGLLRGEPSPVRLFSCPNGFTELLDRMRNDANVTSFVTTRVHSVFIYGLSDVVHSRDHIKQLSLEVEADGNACYFEVARNHKLGGLMASLRFPPAGNARIGSVPTFKLGATYDEGRLPIFSTDAGAVFLETIYRGIRLFVTTAANLIDLDAELPSGVFDIREHALAALPIILYLKWAFADVCWSPAETGASLILDDPLLRPSYGFVNYRELLHLMQQHNFATTIAFIPWNWRRSVSETVALFNENPKNYSISVHGCNHTAAEFSGLDKDRLFERSERALRLMELHERETGIHHDRVMVFPHGVFSEAAMAAIKRTDFFATASNELMSKDDAPKPVTVAEAWDVALMRYSECALFTRRSLTDGLEHIAFDALLGKPALIVLHHEDCTNGCRRVIDFVERMNALPIKLQWRSLGDVLRRSCRQRQASLGVVEVEMYGTELLLENRRLEKIRFDVSRLESDPRVIRTLTADAEPLEWNVRGNRIVFSLHLPPGGNVAIRLRYYPLKTGALTQETMSIRARTLFRRYLCEARDNYLTRYWRRGFSRAPSPAPRRNSSAFSGAELSKEVRTTLDNFTHWLSRYGESSWDHQSFFAGPLGRRAKSVYYRHPKLGTAAVAPMIFFEAILPAGRRLFHRPMRFPIADAHYAMGFAFLYEATGQRMHLERAIHFLRALQRSRSPGFAEYCWGYPFDWTWRGGVILQNTPLITTTPYCYEAFLQVWQHDRRDEWHEVLASIVRHTCHDINDVKTSVRGSQCSYTANKNDRGGVINAAAYRAFLLASASQVFSDDAYWQIGERNMNFVLENQSPDGSWPYAADGVRDFVDHFHTCFVMKSLAKIHSLNGDAGVAAALKTAVDYYFANLLDEEGMPKPFARAPRLVVYKRELYDCAECVNLCLLLRDRFPQFEDLLNRVVRQVLNRWAKRDGSFRSRRLHFGWDNVPMHRWGQSQMFRALAYYLVEEEVSLQPVPKVHDRSSVPLATTV